MARPPALQLRRQGAAPPPLLRTHNNTQQPCCHLHPQRGFGPRRPHAMGHRFLCRGESEREMRGTGWRLTRHASSVIRTTQRRRRKRNFRQTGRGNMTDGGASSTLTMPTSAPRGSRPSPCSARSRPPRARCGSNLSSYPLHSPRNTHPLGNTTRRPPPPPPRPPPPDLGPRPVWNGRVWGWTKPLRHRGLCLRTGLSWQVQMLRRTGA
mmetsp:Transcript_33042/g.77285  ORF Transcript_33042/g.77285 Transcript_33042/m.77285 type:complete len:209 (+) Transcript_33042:327-953(+)